MSFRSSQPLLKCQFAHRLPGRVRIVCRAVKYLSAEQTDLEDHFSQLRGVRSQRMNCAASSVVLTYDPEAVNDEELLESVESLIQIAHAPHSVATSCDPPARPLRPSTSPRGTARGRRA